MSPIFLGQPQFKIFHPIVYQPDVSIFGLENNAILTVSDPAVLAFSSHLALGHSWVIQLSFTWDFSSPPESTQMLELLGFLDESENCGLMRQGNSSLFLYICPPALPIFYSAAGPQTCGSLY